MIEHPKAVEMDKKFHAIYAEVDQELERRYGDLFSLHPTRPPHNTTSNPQMDGLFNLGSSFSPGYGSEHGRGYVIDLQISTLDSIPEEVRSLLWEEVLGMIQEKLNSVFPERNFHIKKDGNVFKILGDFSLGEI